MHLSVLFYTNSYCKPRMIQSKQQRSYVMILLPDVHSMRSLTKTFEIIGIPNT